MKRAQVFHHSRAHGARAAMLAVGIGAATLMAAGGTASAEGSAFAIADVQCNPAGGGVLDLTLINERPTLEAVFVVDGPSGTSTFTVEVGSAAAVTYTGLADGVITVGVTIDGVPVPVSAIVACVVAAAPSVEAAPAAPAASPSAVADDALPRTGSSTGGLLIGTALVVSGAVASLIARRRYS